MFKVLFAKQKSSRGNQRRTEAQSLVYLGFHGSFVFVVSPVTLGDIASRSALIPDGNPASKTGRVLDL